jgi:hypothetical protein
MVFLLKLFADQNCYVLQQSELTKSLSNLTVLLTQYSKPDQSAQSKKYVCQVGANQITLSLLSSS